MSDKGRRLIRCIRVMAILLFVVAGRSAVAQTLNGNPGTYTPALDIPPRPATAMTGSQFADFTDGLGRRAREAAIIKELLRGNLPNFLRTLKPVVMDDTAGNGTRATAVIFVTADYLAIGSNDDFLRIPMGRDSAKRVAARFGAVLPTPKMVDAIYASADYHLNPRPMPPGPEMCSTGYYRTHDGLIDRQCADRGILPGKLVAGHKKDVVITNRLNTKLDRVAIYGWHRPDGRPIQPLSCVHGAAYADYSHGVRLVSDTLLINGQRRSIREVLSNGSLAGLLSNEGPLRLVGVVPEPSSRLARQ